MAHTQTIVVRYYSKGYQGRHAVEYRAEGWREALRVVRALRASGEPWEGIVKVRGATFRDLGNPYLNPYRFRPSGLLARLRGV